MSLYKPVYKIQIQSSHSHVRNMKNKLSKRDFVTVFYSNFEHRVKSMYKLQLNNKLNCKNGLKPLTMAPLKAKLDIEWAKSLLGICLRVPDYWWVGFNSRKLNDGKIESFDCLTKKFLFVLDADPSSSYAMAYSAVYEYADQEASTFDSFHLPSDPVIDPGDQEIGVGQVKYQLTAPADWKKINLACRC